MDVIGEKPPKAANTDNGQGTNCAHLQSEVFPQTLELLLLGFHLRPRHVHDRVVSEQRRARGLAFTLAFGVLLRFLFRRLDGSLAAEGGAQFRQPCLYTIKRALGVDDRISQATGGQVEDNAELIVRFCDLS